MRIHTDKQASVIGAIFAATAKMPGVHASVVPYGSRTRKRAVELRLEGNGGHRNTYEQAATWDEWGVVLAHIFEVDPDALAGSAKRPTYADARHFHLVTGVRFGDLELPEDTHKRHNWKPYPNSYGRKCTKCSATMNREWETYTLHLGGGMTIANDPLIKAEMWEEYLRDHLMVEFGYTEEMADKIVDKWAHYGHPWFGIKWEDLFEHAHKWANVLHEGIENGEFNVQ